MKKLYKRAVYRKKGETYYKFNPNKTVIIVEYQGLFNIALIVKKRYDEIQENKDVCLKKEFIKAYRRARKEIRL